MDHNFISLHLPLSPSPTSQTCTPNPNRDDATTPKVVDRRFTNRMTRYSRRACSQNLTLIRFTRTWYGKIWVGMNPFLVKPAPSRQSSVAAPGLWLFFESARRRFGFREWLRVSVDDLLLFCPAAVIHQVFLSPSLLLSLTRSVAVEFYYIIVTRTIGSNILQFCFPSSP